MNKCGTCGDGLNPNCPEHKIVDYQEPREPFNGQCSKCQHVWTIAYTPMDLTVFCKVCKKACCPMCGADSKHIITPPK